MMDKIKIAPEAMYRVMIDAPIEKVWAELIRTDRPLPFFYGAICHTPGLKNGAPIRMRSPNGKHTSVAGCVTVFEPPYRYGHTFKFTHLDDPVCSVLYELKQTPQGTEFTLTTQNVPANTQTGKAMAGGGKFITENLKALVETGKPTFSGRLLLFIIMLMGPLSPKACLSEHWPMDRNI
jgi:uncharacterized protein YndB with AHSA1/START domain